MEIARTVQQKGQSDIILTHLSMTPFLWDIGK